MKKIKTSDITTAVGMPLKSGSLEHLQAAYSECLDSVVKRILGDGYLTTKVYILYGCDSSNLGSAWTITAGAVFYNGEIYLVPAASFSVSGSNVPVGNIVTTYFSATNADPVQFTNSANLNVHEIRQIVITSGASGSGTANFLDFVPTYSKWVEKYTPTQSTIAVGSGTINATTVQYRRNGNIMHMSFYVESSLGITPASGQVSVNITLPFSADLTTAVHGVYSVAVAGTTSSNFSSGTAIIDSFTGATKVRTLHTLGTAVYYIIGEITYPCT